MTSIRRLLVLFGAIAALLIAVPAAQAAITVTCSHGGNNTALDVVIAGTGSPIVRLKRDNPMVSPDVKVTDETSGVTPVTCSGDNTPSVNDITSITVDDNSTTPGDAQLIIDQGNGPFGPGFPVESSPGQVSEIEWGPLDLDVGLDVLVILPPTGTSADTMRFGDAQAGLPEVPSWNFNNDDDADGGTINVEQYVVFGDTPATLEANNDVITADGPAGGSLPNYPDPFPLFVNFFGGGGDDVLTNGKVGGLLAGDAGNDAIVGGAGIDTGRVGDGNDSFDGGGGSDLVTYGGASGPVTVDLAITAQQNTGPAGLDTITNTEKLQGTFAGDTLLGDGSANPFLDDGDGVSPADDTLNGRGGDDTITANDGADTVIGGQGNDTLTGGLGGDTLSYAQESTGSVTVGLSAGAYVTGGAGTDTLLDNFQNLTGSPFAGDVLTGNTQPNFIDARDGFGDTVTCLAPTTPLPADSVRADLPGVDSINADCETIDFLSLPPPPGESAPPPPPAIQPIATTVKKCKKKKSRSAVAAKKCKKKRG